MITRISDWLDDRTGYRGILRTILYERIPGGARWRYIWGSTLTFAIFVQFVTGFVLWTAYSANAQGAWESVYYIEHVMAAGWLVRGVHHFTAQVTIVLLALHIMQVLVDSAYRAPREVNFLFGLGLLLLVLGLSLSGYLLPWDQKGYWATKVATSIASMTPVIGTTLQAILVGGPDYGHHTLTRFLALHAGILPAALVALVVGHIYLFRRHGVTVPQDGSDRAEGHFWPDQVLRDAVASLAVLATVVGLVLWTGGAHLGAPADPTEPYAAARPEWYFMFLFQWLKYFPPPWELVGAQVIPGLVFLLVAAMPFLGRWRLGHRFNLGVGFSIAAGVGLLTALAYIEDARDPAFLAAQALADSTSQRALDLAASPTGIPAEGALALLRSDPLTQGPRLFAANCSSCHRFDGHDGLGSIPVDDPAASDLAGFGSRAWLTGLLDPRRIGSDEYFGATAHENGRMARFVQRGLADLTEEEGEQLRKIVAAVSAEAALPGQAALDSASVTDIREGRTFFGETGLNCARCHTLGDYTEGDVGPLLTGWGSRTWMLGLLNDPGHPSYYGEDNDGMPAFGADALLRLEQMELIVDWLRGDWYEPHAEGGG